MAGKLARPSRRGVQVGFSLARQSDGSNDGVMHMVGLGRVKGFPQLAGAWSLACAMAWVATPALAAPSGQVITLTTSQVAALGVVSAPVAAQGRAGLTVSAQLHLPVHQQQVLAAPVSGLVTAIHADSGVSVQQGQWLVRLRSTQAQLLRREASQAGSQRELAERSLQRDEQLMAEGLIAQSRLDQSRTQARVARLAAQQQQQAVGQALGGAQVSPQGEITLVAPMSGQIAELMVSVGQRVDEAAPLVKLANLRELWVDLQVPVQQVAALQPGQTVQVLVSGDATATGVGGLTATVLSVAPLIDERTQSATVRARLKQTASGSLRPGQWVQARLQTDAAPAVPESALVTLSASGEQAVFIEEAAGRYRLQGVRTVGRQGADLLVNGLPSAGAAGAVRVVTRGTAALKALLTP